MQQKLGQFYTTNSKYITQNLLDIFPANATIVDMFAGNMDLLNLIKDSHNFEAYDIEPQNNIITQRDTLFNPLNYEDKWVFTNPPYVAKNKNKDKTIYEKYQVDDHYKAALLSIIGCEGGIIIIPLNFLSSEDDKIRINFLKNYKIQKINIFEETVFNDTTYTICCFSFIKSNNDSQKFIANFYPSKEIIELNLKKEEGYKIGYEIYNLPQANIKISRLLKDDKKNKLIPSNIFLYAIDSGSPEGKIKLALKNHFYGKNTDRAFATICFNKEISLDNQKLICDKFNQKINFYRQKYKSLFLTNFRCSTKHMARKRIGFDLAYSIISNIILENNI